MTSGDIGSRIRKRRQILGLRQREVAQAVGVAVSTVANWESGKHFPNRHQARVEQVLGISLDPDPVPRTFDDPALQAIWDDGRLPEPERAEAIEAIERRRAKLAAAGLTERQQRGLLNAPAAYRKLMDRTREPDGGEEVTGESA